MTFHKLYTAYEKEKANLIKNKTKQTSEKARRYRGNAWLLFYLFIYVIYFHWAEMPPTTAPTTHISCDMLVFTFEQQQQLQRQRQNRAL